MSLRVCSRFVFRCFKALEHAGDTITGYAGPFFVAIAWILIPTGVICFFAAIAPTLSFKPITIPICLWIALNILVHYYYACTIPPGTPDDGRGTNVPGTGFVWAQKRGGSYSSLSGREETHPDSASEEGAGLQRCKKCHKMRPERSHHCRICGSCILKYDHHCPPAIKGVNQCVGLHNERYFILFMAYLSIGCAAFVSLGFHQALQAFNMYSDWDELVPRTLFLIIYVLAIALGLAIGIMCVWNLYLVGSGETTVENYDFHKYRIIAKARGDTFVNCYNLGFRKNLSLHFNLGPTGYPYYTLLLPYRCVPYTDGYSWARIPGFARHAGIQEDDEMTDEES